MSRTVLCGIDMSFCCPVLSDLVMYPLYCIVNIVLQCRVLSCTGSYCSVL